MKKDAYYFPHFSNARQDRKVRRLRKELGIEGYGIYFMLLEVLRDQMDFKYPICDIDLLADEFGTSEAKIKAVITTYGLFEFDNTDETFFSIRFNEFMQPWLTIKNQRSLAGKASAAKRREKKEAEQNKQPFNNRSTTVQRPFNDRSTKEKKRKEKKGKESDNTAREKFDLSQFKNPEDYTEEEKRELMIRIYDQLKTADIWKEDVARATGHTPAETWHQIKSFLDEIKAKEDYFKPLREIKRHCVAWIKSHQPVTNGR